MRCAPGGPTGMTMMPPVLSCCSSGGGMWSMPQVTMILSNGAVLLPAVVAARLEFQGMPQQPRSGCAASTGSGNLVEPSRQPVELPLVRECCRLVPRGRLIGERGQRGRGIHRRDPAVEPQLVGLGWKPPGLEQAFERSVLAQQ